MSTAIRAAEAGQARPQKFGGPILSFKSRMTGGSTVSDGPSSRWRSPKIPGRPPKKNWAWSRRKYPMIFTTGRISGATIDPAGTSTSVRSGLAPAQVLPGQSGNSSLNGLIVPNMADTDPNRVHF